MSRIAIIGAGAWGSALAIVLGRERTQHPQHTLQLWTNEREVAESVANRRINELFLPGFVLPESVSATTDLNKALEAAEIVVSVMPSQHCRALFERMAPMLRAGNTFRQLYQGT